MRQYILSDELMNDLEDFSAKIEMFSWFIDHINRFAWDMREKHHNKEFDELAGLTEMLSDLVALYDHNLDTIISDIEVVQSEEIMPQTH